MKNSLIIIFIAILFTLTSCGKADPLASSNFQEGEDNIIATRLSADTYAGHTDVQVAHANNGDMLAVWSTSNALGRKLLYSYYTASTGLWSDEESVGTDSYRFSLSSNGGEFLLAFSDSNWDIMEYGIYESRFNGTQWSPKILACNACSSMNRLSVTSNGSGYAMVFDSNDGIKAVINNGVDWGTPLILNSSGGSATSPSIASNGIGYAVTWPQRDTTSYSSPISIKANTFNGTNWEGEIFLEVSSSNLGSPTIASNGSGYAVTWSGSGIHANIYSSGSWKGATKVSGTLSRGSVPTIASNGTGYAVTWFEYPNPSNIYATVYSGSSWSTPLIIDNSSTECNHARITSNGTGYAVVWQQRNGNNLFDVYVNIYTGAAWMGASSLEAASTDASYEHMIAYNGQGYSAFWVQDNGTFGTIYTSTYNSGWGSPKDLVTGIHRGSSSGINGQSQPYRPYMASLSNGTTMAVWAQYDSQNGTELYGSIHNGISWDTPQLITDHPTWSPSDVALSSDGTTFILAYGMPFDVIYTRIHNGSGWEAPKPTTMDFGINVELASNGNGYILLAGDYWDSSVLFHNAVAWDTTPYTLPVNTSISSLHSDGLGYIAAWAEDDWSTSCTVKVIRYNGTAWQPEEIVWSGSSGCWTGVSIASDGTGYALSWAHYSSPTSSLYASVYDGSSWSTTGLLVDSTTQVDSWYGPKLASNGSSYALVWNEYDPALEESANYISQYNGVDWSSQYLISNSAHAYNPNIASSGSGYGVLWEAYNGTVIDMYFRSVESGLPGDVILMDKLDTTIREPAIISTGMGYVMTWLQEDPLDDSVLDVIATIMRE